MEMTNSKPTEDENTTNGLRRFVPGLFIKLEVWKFLLLYMLFRILIEPLGILILDTLFPNGPFS